MSGRNKGGSELLIAGLVVLIGLLVAVFGMARITGFAPPKPGPGWAYVAIGAILVFEGVQNHV